jgi:trk system potassium uptake protein TrkA
VKAVVLGAGDLVTPLLGHLAERWDVVVVERDRDRLERAARSAPVATLLAPGPLAPALEQAGLARAGVLLAASEDDALNLEACRLAASYGVPRVAVAVDPEALDDYRRAGARAVSADRVLARRLASALEPQRILSVGLAGELAEVIDIRVAARSPVCGRPLRSLGLEGWLVVGVRRGQHLEVPHGDTILEAGDVVTLVGENSAREEMVKAFTSGIPRFPTEFGPMVAVALRSEEDLAGPVAEAAHLAAHSAAAGLLIVHRPAGVASLVEEVRRRSPRLVVQTVAVDDDPRRALLRPLPSAGMVVVPAPRNRGSRREVTGLLRAARRLRLPLLVSRGSFPYARVLAPARESRAARAAAQAAIDIAAYEACPLIGLAVIPPIFIAADDARDQAVRAAGRLQQEAAARGVEVRRVVCQGNEVRLFGEASKEGGLVVLGTRRRPTPLTPGVAGHLLRRLKVSVLVVPS